MVQETRSGVPAGVFHETLESFQQQLDDHTTGMGAIGARMDRMESSFAALQILLEERLPLRPPTQPEVNQIAPGAEARPDQEAEFMPDMRDTSIMVTNTSNQFLELASMVTFQIEIGHLKTIMNLGMNQGGERRAYGREREQVRPPGRVPYWQNHREPPWQQGRAPMGPRPVKLEFPRFRGGDPTSWVYRALQFFHYYQIPEEEKGPRGLGEAYALAKIQEEYLATCRRVPEGEEGVESELEECDEEIEVEENDPEITLNALLGSPAPKTMRVTSNIKQQKAVVKVANGAVINTKGEIKGLLIEVQGHQFQIDFSLLELGGSGVVLGTQWLRTLGVISWDFEKLEMGFTHQSKKGLITRDEGREIKYTRYHLQYSWFCSSMLLFSGNHKDYHLSGDMNIKYFLRREPNPSARDLTEVEYLGHIISGHGVQTDPKKTAAMIAWPIPKSIKALRGFLGLTGYYRKFIKGYGQIASPLTSLLKKDAFGWNEAATDAFEKLKVAVSQPPVLALPDFTKSFVVECDASRIWHWSSLECKWNTSKGKENLVADALSRQADSELFLEIDKAGRMEDNGGALLWAISFPSPTWLVELKQSYADEPATKQLLDTLIQGQVEHQHYSLQNGLILFKNRIYLGPQCILKQKTSRLISRTVIHARESKLKPPNLAGLLQPLSIPYRPWHSISMDFIEGLPNSNKHSVILVVVDRLTKYVHFIPLSHPYTAAKVASLFMQHVFKLHGLPSSIVSDRDTAFTSIFWQELFIKQGIELAMSSAYHPQTDGQTEVVNRSLEQYLRAFASDKPQQWVDWLPLAEFWFNTNYHTSTHTSPFEALYGYPPPTLMEYIPGTTKVEAVEDHLSQRQQALALLKANLAAVQERMKLQTDKHRQEREFQVRDWVYLRLQPFKQRSMHQKMGKLAPKFYGPYQVIQRIGAVAYKLDLPADAKIHPVFHVSCLKMKLGQSILPLPQLPPVDAVEQLTPEPAQVLHSRNINTRRHKGGTEVLVQWRGTSKADATWEPLHKLQQQFPHLVDKVL
uniref:Integrase catalytic domain-containing protein n=1 Tax=Fagus sylvatica TaxID=28930 RepID=A0A2N9IYS4_FAGSY